MAEGTQTAHDDQPAKELESIAWTVRPHFHHLIYDAGFLKSGLI